MPARPETILVVAAVMASLPHFRERKIQEICGIWWMDIIYQSLKHIVPVACGTQ